MPHKPVRIYGVLSKITFAKDQLPTPQTPGTDSLRRKKAETTVPPVKKMTN